MRRIYVAQKDELDPFITRRTGQQIVFTVRGAECLISVELWGSHDTFYFHVEEFNGKAMNAIVETVRRPEFSDRPAARLVVPQRPDPNIPIPTPRSPGMFDKYTISAVEFGEVNPVSLEATVEELAKTMPEVSLRTKGDDAYLVRNGVALKLDGEEFRGQIRGYLEGKTLGELRDEHSAMYQLVTRLGLVNSVTLTRAKDDFVSMLE